MINIFNALLLGVIQGISEFLPISSTGHLILVERLLGLSQETYGLAFDASLHLGTLLSLVLYFRIEIGNLFTSFFHNQRTNIKNILSQPPLLILLLIGTVPAMVIGLFFENVIDTKLRSPQVVGMMLILFSFVLFYVEKFGIQIKKIGELKWTDSILIGFAQAVALIPGVSRSGITIAAGMQRKLKRFEAARFAFLLSIPIVIGAGGKQMINTAVLFINQQVSNETIGFFAVGIISSSVMGYFTIKYFLRYLSSSSLYPFIIYRIILGIIVLSL